MSPKRQVENGKGRNIIAYLWNQRKEAWPLVEAAFYLQLLGQKV
jgi:hypothetical protein